MKLLKHLLFSAFLFAFAPLVLAQDAKLIGSWQLLETTNCMDSPEVPPSVEDVRRDLEQYSKADSKVITFKTGNSGEESTRILFSSKAANQKKFLYRFDGEMLVVLDKKSRTISDSYIVDKFTADSLILSNSSRPCEIRVFAKISPQPN